MEVLHSPHLIHNLEDVVQLLKKVLNDEIDHYNLKIVDINQFSMHLVGEQFHQTITPSVMKGFLDLQTAIYRSYAQIKYDDVSIQRLSKEEKLDLEMEVKVIDGSSGFGIDWQELFNKIIEKTVGKMNSKQSFIAVLALILAFAGHFSYSEYLSTQKEIRLAEIEQEKDAVEKQERLATIALLADKNNDDVAKTLDQATKFSPSVKAIREEANNASYSLIKNAQAAEKIDFDNGNIKLSGEAAKELSKNPPTRWQDVRIDGFYHIINVDSSHAAKRKIRVRNIETQQEILAILENDTLDQRNLNIIQEAEWGYTPVYLKIWAKELSGRYKEAEIKEAIKSND
ncbi:hypothetical protein ACG9XQ_10725 [Acinetobacter baumannii]|uniref:hypothetical protein n=1 Tax=Acinetobacter calcoaceticus/baumannii complex TaxID=909768 RepID=UPI00192CDE71|nr:hypothetical protein [Acinetobacter pittii]HEM7769503.1 hypothetical protein [Acinetobacter baumannii]